MFRKKAPTITVNVKQEPYDYSVKRKVFFSSDGQRTYVVMEKPTKTTVGWELDIQGKLRNSTKGFYVDAVRGQKTAMLIDVKNNEVIGSKWNIDQIKEFADMNIFKARYGKMLADLIAAIKPWLIVVIVISIIALAISGYSLYMLTKIPEQIATMLTPTPTPTPPMIR
jgi:hypothetical protein